MILQALLRSPSLSPHLKNSCDQFFALSVRVIRSIMTLGLNVLIWTLQTNFKPHWHCLELANCKSLMILCIAVIPNMQDDIEDLSGFSNIPEYHFAS